MRYAFETDGAVIYRQSFATIRNEADLARFSPDEEPVVVRMIHAAGMVGLEAHIRFTPRMATLARAALQNGAPVQATTRNTGSSASVTRPSYSGMARRPSTSSIRHGVSRKPGARPAR